MGVPRALSERGCLAGGSGSGILVVENDADEELLTLRALGRAGVAGSVVVVRDGAEALDYLFARGPHAQRDPGQLPKLILLDLNLPKVHGLDVLRCLRQHQRTAHVPVVIFSSSDEQRDRSESRRLGANGYVCKPVSSQEHFDAVQQIARDWLEVDAPVSSVRGKNESG